MSDVIFMEMDYDTRENEPQARTGMCQRFGMVDSDGWLSMGTSDMIELTSVHPLLYYECTASYRILIPDPSSTRPTTQTVCSNSSARA